MILATNRIPCSQHAIGGANGDLRIILAPSPFIGKHYFIISSSWPKCEHPKITFLSVSMVFSPRSNEKADAAKKANRLLNTISLVGTAATALRRLQDKFSAGNPPSLQDLSNFGIIISSLEYITRDGREHTAKASPVSHLLLAYNMRSSIEHSKFLLENPCPKNKSISMWKLKC